MRALASAIDGIEVFVVDDGSSDGTVAKATSAGAKVIAMGLNRGKGGALNEAFSQIDLVDDDVVLFADADLGESAGEADKLTRPILAGKADMTIATFGRAKRKGGFGLVKGLARWGIRRLGGMETVTPLSGQRALKAGVFRAVGGLERGYGMEVGLTIDTLRRGFRIVEVPTSMTHRETGRDVAGFRHRGRQFVAVAWALVRRLGSG